MSVLTLDQVDAAGEFYGVKVGGLGEDGDIGTFALTHDRRRAIAAACAFYRADGDVVVDLVVTGTKWWRVVDDCGCGDACPHEPDEFGFVEHDSCAHYGLPPCVEEVFSWIGVTCKADDADALPVTLMEVGLR